MRHLEISTDKWRFVQHSRPTQHFTQLALFDKYIHYCLVWNSVTSYISSTYNVNNRCTKTQMQNNQILAYLARIWSTFHEITQGLKGSKTTDNTIYKHKSPWFSDICILKFAPMLTRKQKILLLKIFQQIIFTLLICEALKVQNKISQFCNLISL